MASKNEPEYDENGVLKRRVKNPNPAPEPPAPLKERREAGSPGSPVALPGDPEAPEEKTAAKKAAAKK
jgi:hypothetical protein